MKSLVCCHCDIFKTKQQAFNWIVQFSCIYKYINNHKILQPNCFPLSVASKVIEIFFFLFLFSFILLSLSLFFFFLGNSSSITKSNMNAFHDLIFYLPTPWCLNFWFVFSCFVDEVPHHYKSLYLFWWIIVKIILMASCDIPFSHFHCSCAQKFLSIPSVLSVLGIFKSVWVVVH